MPKTGIWPAVPDGAHEGFSVVENSLKCCPTSALGGTQIPSKDGKEFGKRCWDSLMVL